MVVLYICICCHTIVKLVLQCFTKQKAVNGTVEEKVRKDSTSDSANYSFVQRHDTNEKCLTFQPFVYNPSPGTVYFVNVVALEFNHITAQV